MKLALIGRDIGYTRSPDVHRAIGEATGLDIDFEVFDVKYDMLGETVKNLLGNFDGFFVTKPYKREVKRYISFDGAGGVNVVRSCDGKAFNTDGTGFIRALDGNFADWRAKVNGAVVLGAGGGAFAVIKALAEAGKKVYILNRTLMHALKLCNSLGARLYSNQPAELIVNCTPLGTFGEDALKAFCVPPFFDYAFDLVYGEDTPFLRRIRADGGQTAGGGDMLIYQAIEGDMIISGKRLDIDEVYKKVISRLGEGI